MRGLYLLAGFLGGFVLYPRISDAVHENDICVPRWRPQNACVEIGRGSFCQIVYAKAMGMHETITIDWYLDEPIRPKKFENKPKEAKGHWRYSDFEISSDTFKPCGVWNKSTGECVGEPYIPKTKSERERWGK